jgi:hypothetical protein
MWKEEVKMLSIEIEGESFRKTWWVNSPHQFPLSLISKVKFIDVSDEELTHIRYMFSSYPVAIPRGKRVVLWGDFAKTILANLTNTFGGKT